MQSLYEEFREVYGENLTWYTHPATNEYVFEVGGEFVRHALTPGQKAFVAERRHLFVPNATNVKSADGLVAHDTACTTDLPRCSRPVVAKPGVFCDPSDFSPSPKREYRQTDHCHFGYSAIPVYEEVLP